MINWPAILKISADDELIYIHDQQQWDQDPELYSNNYSDNDRLIDTTGNLFLLTAKADHQITPEATGDWISLYDVLGLVKAHAAQKGSCCVSKLYAPTIRDAIKIVEALDNT